MIAIVQGTLLEKGLDHILVDTGGIGYRVRVPLRTLAEMGELGSRVCLRTHLEVREDSWTLFGFTSPEEVEMFHMLTSVNGVGPKMALAILSVHDVPQVARGIASEDERMFTRISGVGKKTAGRLLLELKEKVQHLAIPLTRVPVGAAPASEVPSSSPGKVADEVRQALSALGFQAREIDEALEVAAREAGEDPVAGTLLRHALAFFRQR